MKFSFAEYGYNKKENYKTWTYWRCENISCPGRLKSLGLEVLYPADHNHAPDGAEIEVQRQMADMKSAAKTT